MQTINTGISDANRKTIADGLIKLLADTYVLYFKTHRFHWNVQGPLFMVMHTLFEKQYEALFLAVDTIAERVRALGHFPPMTIGEHLKLSVIKEESNYLKAEEMVKQLLNDHETMVRHARELLPIVEECEDAVTADLLTERMEHHEQTAWMLRSHLE